MEKIQKNTDAASTDTRVSLRGIEVSTQRTLADSMHKEHSKPSPDGIVDQETVEEDTILINPDADSMESRG